jgi:hypothetical protein
MKTPLACLVAGLVVGAALDAGAQTLDPPTLQTKWLGYGPAIFTTGVVNGDYQISEPTGQLDFDSFVGFCVDPFAPLIVAETVVYKVQDPATLTEVGAVQRILGGYYASGRNSLDAAGAQWAIWEAIFDGTTDPTFESGLVRLQDPGSAVAVRALDYLNDLASLPAVPMLYLTNPTRQDVITVPEPGPAAALGCALALILLRRRR